MADKCLCKAGEMCLFSNDMLIQTVKRRCVGSRCVSSHSTLSYKLFQDTTKLLHTSLFIQVSFIKLMGHPVMQLVEALRYKPEGCGFDSR